MSQVFIDQLFRAEARGRQAFAVGAKNDHRWCHMWSDDIEALHKVASKIGLKREWFQNKPGFPHYDLTPGRRQRALQAGAIETSLWNWLRPRREKYLKEREAQINQRTGGTGAEGISASAG